MKKKKEVQGWAIIYIPSGEIQQHEDSNKPLHADAMIGFNKQDKEDYEAWCYSKAKTSFNGTQWKVVPCTITYEH